MTTPHDVNSPVFLITGAGKGLGRSIAEAILGDPARHGNPRLLLTSRTGRDLVSLRELAPPGVHVEVLPLELSVDPVGPVRLAVEKFGRIDAVLHCAGVGRFGDFLELTRDDLESTMQTNVEASFLFMQGAYAQMKSQSFAHPGIKHRGDLVWITSVAAVRPFEQSAIYCMSKYAQRGLIEVMRLYGRRDGIRILDIRPGAALTPMWGDVDPATASTMMRARDVAQAILDALLINPRASVEEIVIRPIGGDL